jgi:hypothetical protein
MILQFFYFLFHEISYRKHWLNFLKAKITLNISWDCPFMDPEFPDNKKIIILRPTQMKYNEPFLLQPELWLPEK